MLYLVPTPIGNLGDITLRAIEVLRSVDKIAAEDTRRARILLTRYEIKTPVLSFHSYSSERKVQELVGLMAAGASLALISEAGTPGISDPAYPLVRGAIAAGITVQALPGPTAFVPALVASGLPTHEFIFLGFLPKKKGRQTLLKSLLEEERTVVFYESPHRVARTLAELAAVLGNRPAAVCRELTKMHEETRRGPLPDLASHFAHTKPRGEFTIVLGGKKAPPF